jgi:MerR family transcriptional regulator, copper efflux regulator
MNEVSEMTDDLMQIGEFAKQADTNLRTLRYYEELGLIKPARRSTGKFRYYSPDQLKRIASIKRLQGLGLSLNEVQEIMAPAPSELTGAVEQIQGGLDKQIELVSTRIASLQTELDELRAARLKLEDCRLCGHDLGSAPCGRCAVANPAAVAVLRSLA